MNLEEEKMMVLFWLGYKSTGLKKVVHLWGKPGKDIININLYNPQDNKTGRKWWDEIWEKIGENEQLTNSYIFNLQKSIAGFDSNFMEQYMWIIHTAKPDICWKALIKTIRRTK